MTEEYLELYKKHRPKVWGDLIGQEPVVKSLQTSLRTNKLPTAFLFCGDRGCGKSSIALILAKAINCLNIKNGVDPCNECEVCLAIDDRTQMGFTYESMANRGSVDDVRAIVRQAKLKTPLKRQVFILDETHNLSKAAFDSLLIPLEEDNLPALFIFCSTERDKIPGTILSRVQSRQINLVKPDVMFEHLKKLNVEDSLGATDEIISDAVRAGKGSVRDTLTSLEGILSTGEVATSFGGALLEAISTHDLASAYKVVADATDDGYDGRDLAEQLFSDLRDLLLLVSGVDKSYARGLPVKNLRAVATGFIGKSGITVFAEELSNGIDHMRLGADSRTHLEIALLRGISKLQKLQKLANKNKQ